MPTDGSTPCENDNDLLRADEPLPFSILNPDSEQPVLLVCDHASNRFPAAVGELGLNAAAKECHLAWDIGAAAVTKRVAGKLGLCAVLAGYSRLVVDCNRDLMDPSAFLEYGDGVLIPGNRGLTQNEKDRRARELYWPYHYAIDIELRRLSGVEYPPAFIAIHSFAPVLDGIRRDCEIGVLWDADRATAELFIDGFRDAGFIVGDNEPYSGKAPMDFTIDHHAEAANLPHVGLEIRHDLIREEAGVARISAILADIIERVPAGRTLEPADGESTATG